VVIKSAVTNEKESANDLLDVTVLIERLKRLRALNKEPDKIGLTQYRWRSFSIAKVR